MNVTLQGISVFSQKPTEVELAGDVIRRVRQLDGPAGDLPLISPGFLDMQVNGFRGSDYSLEDFGAQHVHNIVASLGEAGTTQHVATIVTGPQDRIVRNLKVIARVARESREVGQAIAGIHVEGPFISSEDGPRGAHDPRFVRDPDFAEFEQWREAAEGLLRIVTVAPERPGALAFIEKVTAAGVTVAIGHTGATPELIHEAVAAGARVSTHLGNGSYTQVPRLRNYIWEQLAADELVAGIITDGFHLPASVVKVITRAKGLERLVIASDAALLGGYEPGVYKWGNLDVQVFPDGHLGLPGTSILAGAAHMLDWDLAQFVLFTGLPLGDAVRLCTVNPARILGLSERFGTLVQGAPANLVLFRWEPESPRLRIEKSFCAGREIYSRPG
jgi:N-acetylglucosamine-6-phosphate deacetylase